MANKRNSESSLKPEEDVERDENVQPQVIVPVNNKVFWTAAAVVLLAVVCALWQRSPDSTPPVPKEVNVVDVFNQEMKKLETTFPNQHPELWRRSLIHLRRHLKTKNPTEPVSLILTSDHRAEKTLGCLAQCLARAFSTAHNTSVLNINGKNKASQDSVQVKLDIDGELKKAFEGKKSAAVIHHFEELPPGSTLIFFHYCDHENAAYKDVFLVFTVMLDPEVELTSNDSLRRVGEMVKEHIKQKFVPFDKSAMFNQMDVDKLGGLWTRIAHLILPVAAEKKIEEQGCGDCESPLNIQKPEEEDTASDIHEEDVERDENVQPQIIVPVNNKKTTHIHSSSETENHPQSGTGPKRDMDREKGRKPERKEGLYSEDLKPRPPLKRTRKMRDDDEASRAFNGSKEPMSLAKEDEEESPVKMQKLEEKTRSINEKGDGLNQTDEADVEMREKDRDQKVDEENSDMEVEQDHKSSLKGSSDQHGTEKVHPAPVLEEHLESEALEGSQMSIHLKNEENYRPVAKYGGPSSLGAVQEAFKLRNRKSMTYQNPIREKPKSCVRTIDPPGLDNWNRYPPTEPQKSNIYQTLKYPITIQTANHKNTELKNLQKPVTSKASPPSSSKVWTSYVCKLLLWSLILTGLLGLVFLVCQKFLRSSPQNDVVSPKTVDKFDLELIALEALFPSQRSVFWKRSRKHLKSHLEKVNPSEPVSVILTAGLQAERTLGCIARSLAMAYSATHNASILEIKGTTISEQDSTQVKLEIDEALRKAFEGDKPAAVVHRFEELPPGSTLIFYRYCDHENAAYKKVFLVFTVMLSVDEIAPKTSLSAVEDMVYDQIKQKFVISNKSTMFNQMDVDKLSGLWSRISHLILPVAAEEKIEQQGCEA
uniref:Torsin-1A-interacting protein 1/2 AAA+ activator domain-containing protein n=1 Tax=Cyprinus carpio carpio TaxID=630221 RepID=A0A9J7YSL4_CYPCA